MPTGTEFELTFRLLFGRRAYHAASGSENPKRRAQWLRQALQKLEHEVNTLDTTDRHKQMMLAELEAASAAVCAEDRPN